MKSTVRAALTLQQQFQATIPPNYPGTLVVLFPATPLIFDGLKGNTFELWMDSDVLTTGIKHFSPGILYTFIIRQIAPGNHKFVWPAACHGGMIISPKKGSVSTQTFVYKPNDALYAIMPGALA